MNELEDLERKRDLLDDLILEYGGKTIDNILFNINSQIKYIKDHGSNG